MNTVKTVGEFIESVRKMREYQKHYFANPSSFSLGLAKIHEALVDKAIAERDQREACKQITGGAG